MLLPIAGVLSFALLWLVIIYLMFNVLIYFRMATAKSASVIICILYLLFFVAFGSVFLLLFPALGLYPGFGDILFLVVAIATGSFVVFFAVMALIAALRRRR